MSSRTMPMRTIAMWLIVVMPLLAGCHAVGPYIDDPADAAKPASVELAVLEIASTLQRTDFRIEATNTTADPLIVSREHIHRMLRRGVLKPLAHGPQPSIRLFVDDWTLPQVEPWNSDGLTLRAHSVTKLSLEIFAERNEEMRPFEGSTVLLRFRSDEYLMVYGSDGTSTTAPAKWTGQTVVISKGE